MTPSRPASTPGPSPEDSAAWFDEARFGMFIHVGPFSALGRGEQALFREHRDLREYAQDAVTWNPSALDMREWAQAAVEAGARYACLTTRHHDGFCLWDSDVDDFSSARSAMGRDLVAEYVEAFRDAGLRIGLYYSWGNWRDPAFFDGPEHDPQGYARSLEGIHAQVEELLTRYGRIDHFFFDGAWPRTAEELRSQELLEKMRSWQPQILVNNRLGHSDHGWAGVRASDAEDPGHTQLGDFDTPELEIVPSGRRWEACDVSTQRLWGYHPGERFRSPEQILEGLVASAEGGGNYLLNVAPDGEGRIPQGFRDATAPVGRWLEHHGEAIHGTTAGGLVETITQGRTTRGERSLYLIVRFWPGDGILRIADLATPVTGATLLGEHPTALRVQSVPDAVLVHGPQESPEALFPVVRLDFAEEPAATDWGRQRLWSGDPRRIAQWAREDLGLPEPADSTEDDG